MRVIRKEDRRLGVRGGSTEGGQGAPGQAARTEAWDLMVRRMSSVIEIGMSEDASVLGGR